MARLVARTAIVVCLALLSTTGIAAGGGADLLEANNNVGNQKSLQKGARNFMNYCSGCHSAQYVRYNTLGEALGITEEQLIENLMFNADKTHETINVSMRASDAQAWFAQVPPDLSLIARSKGTDYIYTFLKSYYADTQSRTGWNNTLVQGVSMPHVLWELEGVKVPDHSDSHDDEHGDEQADSGHADDGHAKSGSGYKAVTAGVLSAEEYDQFVRDTVNFLAFISEPMQLERKKIGVWVMVFLLVFFILSLMLKKEIWKDVKKN
ncbi:MAG: cytochrome c1 [Pseudomonadota bacterium]